jgi:AraC-like DNA-binding protein
MQQNSDIIRYSTENSLERDDVAIVRGQFGRSVFGLDIEPLPDAGFRSAMTIRIRSLAGASMSLNVGGGMRAWRTPELLADGRDDLVMIVNLQSPSLVTQRGQEFVLDERAATLVTLGEIAVVTWPTPDHRILMLNMPRTVIGPLVPNADDAVMRPIPPGCDALRLLINYAGILQNTGGPLRPEFQRIVVDHIYDLVAAAVGGTRDAIEVAKGRGIPAARLSAIKSDILGNLLSRNLSIEVICDRHGITPRYLRMLFAGEQTTFSDFVTGRRLALVLRKLRNPARAGHTISAIAYECGFGDLSYFNRVFRRQFGMTPSEVRAQGVAIKG